jgi:hypothetical protein
MYGTIAAEPPETGGESSPEVPQQVTSNMFMIPIAMVAIFLAHFASIFEVGGEKSIGNQGLLSLCKAPMVEFR